MAPKLNRVTSRLVRPKTDLGNASDTIYLLYQISLINIIYEFVMGED
jgi:hypothetical protein